MKAVFFFGANTIWLCVCMLLAGTDLKLGFFCRVLTVVLSSNLTNHFLDLGFLIKLLVNLKNWVDLCAIKLDIFASARAQENDSYLAPYNKSRTVFRTDAVGVFS